MIQASKKDGELYTILRQLWTSAQIDTIQPHTHHWNIHATVTEPNYVLTSYACEDGIITAIASGKKMEDGTLENQLFRWENHE